jgi:hypothetical protein
MDQLIGVRSGETSRKMGGRLFNRYEFLTASQVDLGEF